jgi:hypothetical protein
VGRAQGLALAHRVLFGEFKTQEYRAHRGKSTSIYVNSTSDFSRLFASSGGKNHPKEPGRSDLGAITPARHLLFRPEDQTIPGGAVWLISFWPVGWATVYFGSGFGPGQSTRRT